MTYSTQAELFLTDDERSMLAGECGEATRLAMPNCCPAIGATKK